MEKGDIGYFIYLGLTGESQIHKVRIVEPPEKLHPRTAKAKVLEIYLDTFKHTTTNLKVGDVLRYPSDKLHTTEGLKKYIAEQKLFLFKFIFDVMELKK